MKTPPVEFLLVCSGVSLRDFELNRLNHAANLRKNLRLIQDELLQAESEAVFARWLIEHREALLASGQAVVLQKSFEFHDPLALAAGPKALRSRRQRLSNGEKEICA